MEAENGEQHPPTAAPPNTLNTTTTPAPPPPSPFLNPQRGLLGKQLDSINQHVVRTSTLDQVGVWPGSAPAAGLRAECSFRSSPSAFRCSSPKPSPQRLNMCNASAGRKSFSNFTRKKYPERQPRLRRVAEGPFSCSCSTSHF